MKIIIYNKEVLIDQEDWDKLKDRTWHLSVSGYVRRTLHGNIKSIYMHKEIMGHATNKYIYVDHIDGNQLNNQKSNLRLCNQSQNLVNKEKTSSIKRPSKSIYKGVAWSRPRNKWIARISVNSREVYGGGFEKETDAAIKANELYLTHYGEFARLNVIPLAI